MDFPVRVSRHTLCFTYFNIASFAPLLNQEYLREINAEFRLLTPQSTRGSPQAHVNPTLTKLTFAQLGKKTL